jgi:hypothetical protein
MSLLMHGEKNNSCSSQHDTNSASRTQYREARNMMGLINRHHESTPLPNRKLYEKCLVLLGNICLPVIGVFDKVRMMTLHLTELRSFSLEQKDLRKDCLDAEMHDTQGLWTMQTAFYATSGALIYRSEYTTGKTITTLDFETLEFLASQEPELLLPAKMSASQNPGQSSVIVKTVTCIQAIWFCSQCIARLNSGIAISLLELNTFAHCISAFFIYGFWWHKPYDVSSHTSIHGEMLDLLFLRHAALQASQRPSTYGFSNAVELCVSDGVGAKVRVAKVALQDKSYGDESGYLKVTEGDMIPGTEFIIQKPGKSNRPYRMPYSGNGIFLLPKQSLIHWQRLWRFVVETSFAMERVGERMAHFQSERRSANVLQSGKRSKNIRGHTFDVLFAGTVPFEHTRTVTQSPTTSSQLTSLVLANAAFLLFGGLHLLAWQYHFPSTAEMILWKLAGLFTASSGFMPALYSISHHNGASKWSSSPKRRVTLSRFINLRIFPCLLTAWIPITLVARTFLFVESFIALPNSPPSTYQIPPWTAYVPHI